MKKQYSFIDVKNCEMCGSAVSSGGRSKHKVLGMRLNQSQGKNPKEKIGIAVSVMKCLNCELIYSNPKPIPNEIEDHYNILPDSYWKKEDLEWNPKYFLDEILFIKKKINFTPGMKSLDIGAGLGKAIITMNKENFDAFGLEPSLQFYNHMISEKKISKDKLKLGKLQDLEYENNLFDFITYRAVLEHLDNPRTCIKKTLNWLKPNGIIHIEVPSSSWLISKFINLYFFLKGTNYVTNLSPMHKPFHFYEFGLKSFKELGHQIGYDIESYRYDVCEIFFFPKIFHPILNWFMKKTNSGMQLTVYLKKKSQVN